MCYLIVNYWYDNNENRFRKQEGALDEVYVLGVNGETEAVFNANNTLQFFNINAARPFGSNETICRQTLVSLPDSTGVSTIYLNTKYKFTSKERDVETGYDYFGARYYDSRIGRWLQVDPLAEKYFGWSPYNYTMCNPLIFLDPDGKQVWIHPETWTRYKDQLLASDAFKIALQLSGRTNDYTGPLFGKSSLSFRTDPDTKHPGYTQLWIDGKFAAGDEYQISPDNKYLHTTVFLNEINANTIPHEVGEHYGYNSLKLIKYLSGLDDGQMYLNWFQDINVLRVDQNAEIYDLMKTLNVNIDPNIIQTEEDVFKYVEPWPED
ncbi:MAG: RHS repeat-associated core domain-containing protein [Ignavibacterium sp.]|nr:RHS repeat-associated core domain-containing protein [Ignavibacterium sp.]